MIINFYFRDFRLIWDFWHVFQHEIEKFDKLGEILRVYFANQLCQKRLTASFASCPQHYLRQKTHFK